MIDQAPLDLEVGFDARHRIEFSRIQVRIRHGDSEFLLKRADHIGQRERIQNARFEQRFFRVRGDRLLRDLLDDGEDAFLSSHLIKIYTS